MHKKLIKLLFAEEHIIKVFRNRQGDIVFVGSFRQFVKRLRIQYGFLRSTEALTLLDQEGYTVTNMDSGLFSAANPRYNKDMSELKSKIKTIPQEPGVYQFSNKDGEVIYIGKAKNLKSRVSQYFGKHDDRPQLPFLLAEATDIQYTVVQNELESLFLENTLIKKFLPKYNIMLRDDKNFAFIKIDYSTQIPQITTARRITDENSQIPISNSQSNSKSQIPKTESGLQTKITGQKSKFFGPFSAAYKIRNTLNLVRRIFPYCANKEVGSRPCFYYYLHRCPGVCIGKISLEEYQVQLQRIESFLSGNTNKIKAELKSDMKIAASKQEFEKAARLRDQLQALELLDEKQTVILNKPVSWDVVSASTESGYACINLFKVRHGKLIDKENFTFEIGSTRRVHSEKYEQTPQDVAQGPALPPQQATGLHYSRLNHDTVKKTSSPPSPQQGEGDGAAPFFAEEGLGEVIQTFLEQYYLETSDAPRMIFAQEAEDPELIDHIVRSRFNHKTEVTVPKKGKAAELVRLGQKNAEEYLKNWLSSQAGHLDRIQGALETLKSELHLEKIPERIECYDISNTQGTNPVGSMVVFKNGLPVKSEYRKFKIQGKKTPDDFAMMKEMLTRRFSRSVITRPDASEAAAILTTGDKIASSPVKAPTPRNDKQTWPLPDLIVIDGGKGQLGAALEVMDKFKVQSEKLKVIGLAKRIEEIFMPGESEPIILSHDDPALQMLQRLRDEAHRFGITFHRDLRSKQAVRSALDNVPGIGPKTKKLLKEKFGTVANIRKASMEQLAAVVGEKIAQSIKLNI